jgi:hypothetical protein
MRVPRNNTPGGRVIVSFEEWVAAYTGPFAVQGVVELQPGGSIATCCRLGRVPNAPGVYLIDGLRAGVPTLCYIGKAGTMRQDGSFKDQGIAGRLTAKQQDMSRQQYFQQQMAAYSFDALRFRWFVTFQDQVRILPAKAEADLLQAYFDAHSRLPLWNAGI